MPTPLLPPPTAELAPPVLLIVFNRPHLTQRVLEAVRRAHPVRLYVAADGPRPNQPTDAIRCGLARAVVTNGEPWPCAVRTLFRDDNLGCGLGPASAISWFFMHETEGIILEDDCLPTPEFFHFCGELLQHYRHDTRVMHISGNNLTQEAQGPVAPGADSYHFSGRVRSWGWASWRRAWQHFDFDLALLPELRHRGALSHVYPAPIERQYWLHKFEAVRTGQQPAHIWDYQWHFAVAAHGGLAVIPAVNLVANIGFGDDATHTFDPHDQFSHPVGHLPFPLYHPPVVLRDARRDRRQFREHLTGSALAIIRRLAARLLHPFATAGPVPQPVVASATALVRTKPQI